MTLRDAAAIAARLSLRDPQRESLELLARITEPLPLAKVPDLAGALATVQTVAPSVETFERDFPSLCFSLATGVGKTRLMGAFIAYLHRARGIRHFFVLAPNLTIYEKLKRDFTPNTPKFVFPGLQGIADHLVLTTGDDWDTGRGVRDTELIGDRSIHVNIFNIAKINSEVRAEDRGGRVARVKRLNEMIGDSYFNYLSKLDDLVLIMDESHRYRADAGTAALNDLRPVLGLELTATPQVMRAGRAVRFRNIAYDYPLANAIADGFVKEPAVATRQDFERGAMSDEQLERLKLHDGIVLHEESKVELETYARQHDERRVKPFMLVIARDTTHAEALRVLIEHDTFHDGRYIGRVAIVHSQQRGSIQDEMLQRLLAVENPDEPTEIVIHVNMLGEGWDVTNLYTIVPLRTADSRTLVEQSIGRGLRLPYGRKTGVPAVDRLTIVAHDRFQDIIDYANRPDSLIRHFQQIVIGRDVPDQRMEPVRVTSFAGAAFDSPASTGTIAAAPSGGARIAQPPLEFATPEDRAVAGAMRDVARDFEYHPDPRALLRPDVKERFIREVRRRYEGGQLPLPLADDAARMERVLAQTVEIIATRTIGIPRIVVTPLEEVRTGFRDFDLEVSNIRLAPVAEEILVQHLQSRERHHLVAGAADVEARLEDYVVRQLADEPDVAYESNAELLYKVAGQLVVHLRSYLADDAAVRNVLAYHGRAIGANVLAQLRPHRWQSEFRYEARVEAGYHFPRDLYASSPVGEPLRNFREPVNELSRIRQMRFGGFARCLFAEQRFQSDPERRFAVVLEDESDASLKWFKPAPTDVRIFLRDRAYEPDFVIETADVKYLAEPKAANEMESPDVREKARAAAAWCAHAGAYEVAHGGKPWRYLLIPHDAIVSSATLSGIASRFTVGS